MQMAYLYSGEGLYDKAISSIKTADSLVAKYDIKSLTDRIYNAYVWVYEAEKDFGNANLYYKKLALLKDSIWDKDKTNSMLGLEIKYETEKKEQEITLLNKDAALQKIELERDRENILRKNLEAAEAKDKITFLDQEDKIKQLEIDTENTELQGQKYLSENRAKNIEALKKEKDLQESEVKRQKLLKNTGLGGGILILALALILFNRNRAIRRQKKKVEETVDELTVARQKLQESEKGLERKVDERTQELADTNEKLTNEIQERIKAEAEIIEFNKKVAELQMTSLRLQMNPHFIFNSLNSIQYFIYNNNKEEAGEYLTKFSRLIREILEHANDNTISQADEIKMLELYLELEMLRFDNKFDYELEIDPAIDLYNIEIPSMLIQPFVENAIIHGLMGKNDTKGKIKIIFQKEGDGIRCIIEDNGIGREKAEEIKKQRVMHKKSLGIKVTKDRLEMMMKTSSNIKEEYINITDLKDKKGMPVGTRVEIRIPVEED